MQIVLAIVLALVTAPTPAALPAATFAGVTLGEPATKLIAERGEPMVGPTNGENAMWFYFSPGGGSMELVGIRKGYVSTIALAPKQLDAPVTEDITMDGVRLGGPFSEVPSDAATGASITVDGIYYTFKPSKDRKTVLTVSARLPDDAIAKLPPLPQMPLLHEGSSFADAVIVRAPTRDLSTVFETGYMSGHDYCFPAKWKLLRRSQTQVKGKTYDVLDTACDSSSDEKTVYFDVSSVPLHT
jgi:hypothetical protein